MTLPVLELNRPLRSIEVLCGGELNGGFINEKIDHINGIIFSVLTRTFEAVKLYGCDCESIKRRVYDLRDPLIVTTPGQKEYHPEIRALLEQIGEDTLPEQLLNDTVNLWLKQRGITKESEMYEGFR